MGELVAHLPAVAVDAGVAAAIAHGRVLPRQLVGATGDGPWAMFDGSGQLLAVYEAYAADRMKPTVVVCTEAPGG